MNTLKELLGKGKYPERALQTIRKVEMPRKVQWQELHVLLNVQQRY